MKLILKEAPLDFDEETTFNTEEDLDIKSPLETPIKDDPSEDEVTLELDTTNDALAEFVASDSLNELRDLFIEFEDNDEYKNPRLLLLNNNVVVIAQEGNVEDKDDNTTFLYCLGDDDTEFSLVPLPDSIDSILSSNSIIQYTPSNISDVHDKVVELFMKQLSDDTDEDELEVEQTEEVTEPTEEPVEDTIPEEPEEDEDYV